MKADAADVCGTMAHACDEGAASRRQRARQCRVSVACLQTRLRRRRLTGRLTAAAHTGGRRGVLDADALALVARLIRAQTDLTLAELGARVAAERGGHVRVPTMYRAVRRLRLPYKQSCCLPLSGTRRVGQPSVCSTATGVPRSTSAASSALTSRAATAPHSTTGRTSPASGRSPAWGWRR
jgi:transposase